jgi:hypothetical protein
MIWSTHSRWIDPIDLSATPLGPGNLGDLISIADQVTWSIIPGKSLRDLMYDPLYVWMRCYVDPERSLRTGLKMMNTWSSSKVTLGTTNGFMAAICVEWLRRKVSHLGEAEAGRSIMYFATLN